MLAMIPATMSTDDFRREIWCTLDKLDADIGYNVKAGHHSATVERVLALVDKPKVNRCRLTVLVSFLRDADMLQDPQRMTATLKNWVNLCNDDYSATLRGRVYTMLSERMKSFDRKSGRLISKQLERIHAVVCDLSDQHMLVLMQCLYGSGKAPSDLETLLGQFIRSSSYTESGLFGRFDTLLDRLQEIYPISSAKFKLSNLLADMANTYHDDSGDMDYEGPRLGELVTHVQKCLDGSCYVDPLVEFYKIISRPKMTRDDFGCILSVFHGSDSFQEGFDKLPTCLRKNDNSATTPEASVVVNEAPATPKSASVAVDEVPATPATPKSASVAVNEVPATPTTPKSASVSVNEAPATPTTPKSAFVSVNEAPATPIVLKSASVAVNEAPVISSSDFADRVEELVKKLMLALKKPA